MCEFISAVSIYFIHNKEMLTAIFVSHTEKYFDRFSWKPIKNQKDEQNVSKKFLTKWMGLKFCHFSFKAGC